MRKYSTVKNAIELIARRETSSHSFAVGSNFSKLSTELKTYTATNNTIHQGNHTERACQKEKESGSERERNVDETRMNHTTIQFGC